MPVVVDITDLKLMLGYDSMKVKDELLSLLKRRAMQAICLYINKPVDQLPSELEFIADELVASRINLLNSEGMKTESTDISRYDYVNDIYQTWYKWLDNWVNDNTTKNRNRLRML